MSGPVKMQVEAGKTYWWCACGKSKKFPLCDGAHKLDPDLPRCVAFEADTTREVYFCGCGKTANQPLCDGSHNG